MSASPQITSNSMSQIITYFKTLGNRLHQLASTVEEWSRKTFGPATARGPQGPTAHLIKEANELAADPYDIKEAADLLILLIDLNWRAGRTIEQLLIAAINKMKENQKRQWQKPGPDGAIEHVRG